MRAWEYPIACAWRRKRRSELARLCRMGVSCSSICTSHKWRRNDMKILLGTFLAALLAVPVLADKGVNGRLQAATGDLHAMTNASDNDIPTDLLNKASCVVVIPNLKKGGFIIGGEYGAGFFSCRKPNGIGWSAPGCIKMTGGKFGLLVGGAETDVIMLVMNQGGMEH